MNIQVRLFAGFRTGRFSRREMDLPDGTTLHDLVVQLEIEPTDVSLPLINGKYGDLDRLLSDGDIASLFPNVAGG